MSWFNLSISLALVTMALGAGICFENVQSEKICFSGPVFSVNTWQHYHGAWCLYSIFCLELLLTAIALLLLVDNFTVIWIDGRIENPEYIEVEPPRPQTFVKASVVYSWIACCIFCFGAFLFFFADALSALGSAVKAFKAEKLRKITIRRKIGDISVTQDQQLEDSSIDEI